MQNYSLTILIKDKLDEKARTVVIDGVKKDFGSLIKEDIWGLRSLAYPIKHAEKAFYAYFEFAGEPASVITLDKNIRLNEDIIRYLIIKSKKVKVKRKKKEVIEAEKESPEKQEKLEAEEKVVIKKTVKSKKS